MAKKETEIVEQHHRRGWMGKYNLPNASIKKIEQDDEKRAFMAKSIENNLYFFNVGLSDEEIQFFDSLYLAGLPYQPFTPKNN